MQRLSGQPVQLFFRHQKTRFGYFLKVANLRPLSYEDTIFANLLKRL